MNFASTTGGDKSIAHIAELGSGRTGSVQTDLRRLPGRATTLSWAASKTSFGFSDSNVFAQSNVTSFVVIPDNSQVCLLSRRPYEGYQGNFVRRFGSCDLKDAGCVQWEPAPQVPLGQYYVFSSDHKKIAIVDVEQISNAKYDPIFISDVFEELSHNSEMLSVAIETQQKAPRDGFRLS